MTNVTGIRPYFHQVEERIVEMGSLLVQEERIRV